MLGMLYAYNNVSLFYLPFKYGGKKLNQDGYLFILPSQTRVWLFYFFICNGLIVRYVKYFAISLILALLNLFGVL
jgi:hypothetical protein